MLTNQSFQTRCKKPAEAWTLAGMGNGRQVWLAVVNGFHMKESLGWSRSYLVLSAGSAVH